MLLLLSSSARRRYHDDIVRTLALPEGAEFHFRYGEQYVQPDILQPLIAKNASAKLGLVCHLADREGAPPALIPCRFVSVRRVQKLGTSYIFNLRVLEFVRDLDDATLRAKLNQNEAAMLAPAGSDAKFPGGKFVVDIETSLDIHKAPDATAMVAFEQTTESLHANGFGQDTPFYSVLRLAASGADEPEKLKDGQFKLHCAKRYLLDVYTYAPECETTPSDAFAVTIDAQTPDVSFASATTVKLDGRYDLQQFVFSTEQRLFPLPTGLRLALDTPANADTKATEQRCDIVLSVVFQGSVAMAIARVGMIAIGTATPAIIGAYAANKGSLGLAAVMFVAALFTGIATVFPALKKA